MPEPCTHSLPSRRAAQALLLFAPATEEQARTLLSMWRHFDCLTPDEVDDVVRSVVQLVVTGRDAHYT